MIDCDCENLTALIRNRSVSQGVKERAHQVMCKITELLSSFSYSVILHDLL